MYLNNGKIENLILNGVDYSGRKKEFLKSLTETHNYTVQLVFGPKVLKRGDVSFIENNGWITACVDSHFSFDDDVKCDNLTISILNNGNEIVNSHTNTPIFICCGKDIDIDFYFTVGSIHPYNDTNKIMQESFIRVSQSNNYDILNYEALPNYITINTP